MKPRIARTVATALLALAVAAPAAAQLEGNLGALTGENAKGYLAPLPQALSSTLNSAIFQSGAVPKTGFSFNVGLKAIGVTFGDDDRTYTPKDPPGFTGTSTIQAPTVIGSTQSVLQTGQGGAILYHPGGFDLDEFMVAVPQATIGSVMGTRAVVRYITLELGDQELGDFELFGIGGQHSISQYFPNLPVDLALGLFYQSFDVGDGLIESNAFNVNVTASKGFGLVQPYVGLGFDSFSMDAEYTASGTSTRIAVDLDDETNAHFTVGGLLNLPFVKLHAEFNAAAQNGVAVGLSFGL